MVYDLNWRNGAPRTRPHGVPVVKKPEQAPAFSASDHALGDGACFPRRSLFNGLFPYSSDHRPPRIVPIRLSFRVLRPSALRKAPVVPILFSRPFTVQSFRIFRIFSILSFSFVRHFNNFQRKRQIISRKPLRGAENFVGKTS